MRVEKCFKQLVWSHRACQCVGWASLWPLTEVQQPWRKGLLRAQTWIKNTYGLETAQVILPPGCPIIISYQRQPKKSGGGGDRLIDRSPGCSL